MIIFGFLISFSLNIKSQNFPTCATLWFRCSPQGYESNVGHLYMYINMWKCVHIIHTCIYILKHTNDAWLLQWMTFGFDRWCHMDFLRKNIYLGNRFHGIKMKKSWSAKIQIINIIMKLPNATCNYPKWPNMVPLKMS